MNVRVLGHFAPLEVCRVMLPTTKQFVVNAFWDEEAQVWFADSAGVPGLCTEAATVEQFSQKLEVMIPERLENLLEKVTLRRA
jgi:hypothetical protein